jgi:hypothetical protein
METPTPDRFDAAWPQIMVRRLIDNTLFFLEKAIPV